MGGSHTRRLVCFRLIFVRGVRFDVSVDVVLGGVPNVYWYAGCRSRTHVIVARRSLVGNNSRHHDTVTKTPGDDDDDDNDTMQKKT
jgi:hypothetical protein